jgi:hypothetical protein
LQPAAGAPTEFLTLALTEVEVTQKELENCVHHVLAAEPLSCRGYEEPFVHYEFEAASFLLPAVRDTPDLK